MASLYRLLPAGANHIAIARICRQCIQAMSDGGLSYPQIVEKLLAHANRDRLPPQPRITSITPASLKTFMARADLKRINTNNLTIEVIYNFLTDEWRNLGVEISAIIMEQWDVFNPGVPTTDAIAHDIPSALAGLFMKWNDTHDSQLRALRNKLSGTYVMLRKSVNEPDVVVKSTIVIGHSNNHDFLNIRHIHVDRQGVERVSEGFIAPIVKNMYGIMRIERGDGLEILAIKEPIQHNFQRLLGILLSMNIDRKILSALIFLERASDIWNSAPPRFPLSELSKYPPLREVIGNKYRLLDDGTCTTLSDISLDLVMNRQWDIPVHRGTTEDWGRGE
jgi:hypothetical protein